jgi:hypothetical protein
MSLQMITPNGTSPWRNTGSSRPGLMIVRCPGKTLRYGDRTVGHDRRRVEHPVAVALGEPDDE